MFRRSRFSARPNVGTAGRTAAAATTPQEPPTESQETTKTQKEPNESNNNASPENNSDVTLSENAAGTGDGNDQNGEGTGSSASVQRRKRFSIKPRVAPGRPPAISRTLKSPIKAVSATSADAVCEADLEKTSTSSQPVKPPAPRGLQSPRRRRLSEDTKQQEIQPNVIPISSEKPGPSPVSPSEDSPKQTYSPSDHSKQVENISTSHAKEVHSRTHDRVPPSLPDKDTTEISEKAKTLISSKKVTSITPSALSLSRLLNDPSDVQRMIKAQKLRELLRQERCKERNLKSAKARQKEFTLDPNKMTMGDLIYYRPTSNPMISSLEEPDEMVIPPSPRGEGSIEQAAVPEKPPVKGNSTEEEEEEEEEEGAAEEDQEESLMVPQVKVAEDGSLIIDEESLTVEVQRAKGPNPISDRDPIFERGSTTTYSSFKKSSYTRPWSIEETDMFYLAVSMVGTDFSMICQLFPNRARSEIKNKFKKEERENSWRIDKAFRERRKLDIEYFTKLLEKILEFQKEKKKLKSLVRNNAKSKAGTKRTSKKSAKKLSDVEEEDEEDFVDLEGDQEKENEDLLNEGEAPAPQEKKKRKRKKKAEALTEEPNEKKNKTGEVPEDSEAALPESHSNSESPEKTPNVNTAKGTVVKPAKLSRAKAPKPLVPLGLKRGKKGKNEATESDRGDKTTSEEPENEQVNKDESDTCKTSTQESAGGDISSEEEETIKQQGPTRYGRVPKPIQVLAYPSREESHPSEADTTSASPSASKPKPKSAPKRVKTAKPQSDPKPKKPKLVTLRSSKSDFTDEEDEEEQDPGCSSSQDMSAISSGLHSLNAVISEVDDPMSELDILASMPDMLGISQDALCPDSSCHEAQHETGTAEACDHQLDLLVDVIDFFTSEQTEVSQDKSYNEAAQTLLTIGNISQVSQSAQEELTTQCSTSGTSVGGSKSDHCDEKITPDAHEETCTLSDSQDSSNNTSDHLDERIVADTQQQKALFTACHQAGRENSEPVVSEDLENGGMNCSGRPYVKTGEQMCEEQDSIQDKEPGSLFKSKPQSSNSTSDSTKIVRFSKVKPKPNLGRTSRTAAPRSQRDLSKEQKADESHSVASVEVAAAAEEPSPPRADSEAFSEVGDCLTEVQLATEKSTNSLNTQGCSVSLAQIESSRNDSVKDTNSPIHKDGRITPYEKPAEADLRNLMTSKLEVIQIVQETCTLSDSQDSSNNNSDHLDENIVPDTQQKNTFSTACPQTGGEISETVVSEYPENSEMKISETPPVKSSELTFKELESVQDKEPGSMLKSKPQSSNTISDSNKIVRFSKVKPKPNLGRTSRTAAPKVLRDLSKEQKADESHSVASVELAAAAEEPSPPRADSEAFSEVGDCLTELQLAAEKSTNSLNTQGCSVSLAQIESSRNESIKDTNSPIHKDGTITPHEKPAEADLRNLMTSKLEVMQLVQETCTLSDSQDSINNKSDHLDEKIVPDAQKHNVLSSACHQTGGEIAEPIVSEDPENRENNSSDKPHVKTSVPVCQELESIQDKETGSLFKSKPQSSNSTSDSTKIVRFSKVKPKPNLVRTSRTTTPRLQRDLSKEQKADESHSVASIEVAAAAEEPSPPRVDSNEALSETGNSLTEVQLTDKSADSLISQGCSLSLSLISSSRNDSARDTNSPIYKDAKITPHEGPAEADLSNSMKSKLEVTQIVQEACTLSDSQDSSNTYPPYEQDVPANQNSMGAVVPRRGRLSKVKPNLPQMSRAALSKSLTSKESVKTDAVTTLNPESQTQTRNEAETPSTSFRLTEEVPPGEVMVRNIKIVHQTECQNILHVQSSPEPQAEQESIVQLATAPVKSCISSTLVTPVEERSTNSQESRVSSASQLRMVHLLKVKPKPNLTKTSRAMKTKTQSTESGMKSPGPNLDLSAKSTDIHLQTVCISASEQQIVDSGSASSLDPTLGLDSIQVSTVKQSTNEEENTHTELVHQDDIKTASDHGSEKNQNFFDVPVEQSKKQTNSYSGSSSNFTDEDSVPHNTSKISCTDTMASHVSPTSLDPNQDQSGQPVVFVRPEDEPAACKHDSKTATTGQPKRTRLSKIKPKPNIPLTSRVAQLKPQKSENQSQKQPNIEQTVAELDPNPTSDVLLSENPNPIHSSESFVRPSKMKDTHSEDRTGKNEVESEPKKQNFNVNAELSDKQSEEQESTPNESLLFPVISPLTFSSNEALDGPTANKTLLGQGSHLNSGADQEKSGHPAACFTPPEEFQASQEKDEVPSTHLFRRSRSQKPKPNLSQTSRSLRLKAEDKSKVQSQLSVQQTTIGKEKVSESTDANMTPQAGANERMNVAPAVDSSLTGLQEGTVSDICASVQDQTEPESDQNGDKLNTENSVTMQLAKKSQSPAPEKTQRTEKKVLTNIGQVSTSVDKEKTITERKQQQYSEVKPKPKIESSCGVTLRQHQLDDCSGPLEEPVKDFGALEPQLKSTEDKMPENDPENLEDLSCSNAQTVISKNEIPEVPSTSNLSSSSHKNDSSAQGDLAPSELGDSSEDSRKSRPARRGRLIKPKPKPIPRRSNRLQHIQPVENPKPMETDSGSTSQVFTASGNQKFASELRADTQEPEKAVIARPSETDLSSNDAGSSHCGVKQQSSHECKTSSTEGIHGDPLLSVILPEQVPSDPDEPFFILSLTAIPVSSAGEMETSIVENLSYLPATGASGQQSIVSEVSLETEEKHPQLSVEPEVFKGSIAEPNKTNEDDLADKTTGRRSKAKASASELCEPNVAETSIPQCKKAASKRKKGKTERSSKHMVSTSSFIIATQTTSATDSLTASVSAPVGLGSPSSALTSPNRESGWTEEEPTSVTQYFLSDIFTEVEEG